MNSSIDGIEDDDSDAKAQRKKSNRLYYNFVIFCCLYAVAHSTVNVVSAFAAAELGVFLGAFGGFAFYFGFTLSSLIIAKPVTRLLGPKYSVVVAMVSFSVYVGFFCLSLLSPDIANVLYILGACVGGLGEGLFWTGQGIYFSMNSIEYSQTAKIEVTKVMSEFASIFALLFLSIEATSKVLSTILLSIVMSSSSDGSSMVWRVLLFAFYTMLVIMSSISMYLFAIPFRDKDKAAISSNNETVIDFTSFDSEKNSRRVDYVSSQSTESNLDRLLRDCKAVTYALLTNRLLQCITPFQLAFGLNGVFMDSYVCGVIVKKYVGEQYIGVMSGTLSLTSVLITVPYFYLSYYVDNGNYYIMMFGGVCFTLTALPILFFSDETIGQWSFVVWLFIIHGCARGAWENTNKAVLGQYFALGTAKRPANNVLDVSTNSVNMTVSDGVTSVEENKTESTNVDTSLRDTAFASACFTGGLAGAIGYLMFQYVNRIELAVSNIIVGVAAVIGFHLSAKVYQNQRSQNAVLYDSVQNPVNL